MSDYPKHLQCRLEIIKRSDTEIVILNQNGLHISDCAKFYESYGLMFWGNKSPVDYKQVGDTGYYNAKIEFVEAREIDTDDENQCCDCLKSFSDCICDSVYNPHE